MSREYQKLLKEFYQYHERFIFCISDAEYYLKQRQREDALYFISEAQRAISGAAKLIPEGDKKLLKQQADLEHKFNKFKIKYSL